MVPPTQQLNLDITAISGICGSISIACWVVVFSPQIIEQFRRGSADGLSLQFIIVWLLGDVFNILGAMLQGVLPTMLILAVYYTLADIVLLLQCFYYRGFTWYDEIIPPPKPAAAQASIGEANERTGLLSQPANPTYNPFSEHSERERRPSFFSESSVHLSPVVPLVETRKLNAEAPAIKDQKPTTLLQATLFNLFTILLVSAAGVFGWYISERSASSSHAEKPAKGEEHLTFSLWGQIFGYICAVLYLGSRIPQLILNFRRKSTSGVSVLFFLFACIGNLTYVLSIFAYEPPCVGKKHGCKNGVAAREYWRYIAVNASWLAGSLGTLCLDLGIFAQFFHYRERDAGEDDSAIDDDESQVGNGREAERPLLDRDNSGL